MKCLRLVSLALLLLSGRAALAQTLTPAQIAAAATPSVVLIRVPTGLGSGFVIAEDGRIVTNIHVIRDAKQATIVAADGREFTDVEVMGEDPAQDLAVLRVGGGGRKSLGLKPVTLGDSATAKPGDHVVAIGHPLGLGSTVSDGLVSALRDLPGGRSLLQISAPISPGSSGGPVFNDQGQVIGVSTLVLTGGQNLNFAVPINAVKPLLAVAKGVPLASFQAPGRHRNIPDHPLSMLEQCPSSDLQGIVRSIEQAINVGAPLYNQGNIEACYRIYSAAALDIDKSMASCTGPRSALRDGIAAADKLKSWDDKAWAMRDAFDGVVALAAKQGAGAGAGPVTRHVPDYPSTVLADCRRPQAAAIRTGIVNAIHSGAPLYNSGNIEACYRIYEGAISEIGRSVDGCGAAKSALQAGVQTAQSRPDWAGKAWALRDVFDGMTTAIEREQGR